MNKMYNLGLIPICLPCYRLQMTKMACWWWCFICLSTKFHIPSNPIKLQSQLSTVSFLWNLSCQLTNCSFTYSAHSQCLAESIMVHYIQYICVTICSSNKTGWIVLEQQVLVQKTAEEFTTPQEILSIQLWMFTVPLIKDCWSFKNICHSIFLIQAWCLLWISQAHPKDQHRGQSEPSVFVKCVVFGYTHIVDQYLGKCKYQTWHSISRYWRDLMLNIFFISPPQAITY